MRRVFLPPEAFGPGGIITIGGSAHRHLIKVLRLKVGDSLIAVDASGQEYVARLVAVEARLARAEVVAAPPRPAASRPLPETILILGLPKGEKLDLVVQKATELGVSSILPVPTRRSVVRLDGAKGKERCGRWQAIATAAAAQCGRNTVPAVRWLGGLEEALQALPDDTLVLMPWEGERERSLRGVLASRREGGSGGVAVLVGPEGGWAPEEVELAGRYGALTVSLGPRILRCETAAIAALTIILYELGDLGAG